MARRLSTTSALAPLSRPVADLLRDTLAIRPFDPPWLMTGSLIWRRDNSSPALAAFVAAASSEGSRKRRGAGPGLQTGRDVRAVRAPAL
jgi:hypothetical protein